MTAVAVASAQPSPALGSIGSIRSSAAASAVGLGSLRENPLRTVLSMLGVIIGVAALVSVISLGDVMQGFVRGELSRTTDLQTVFVQAQTQTQVDGEWLPLHSYPVFTTRDMEELAASLHNVSGTAMLLSGSARISWPRSNKRRSASVSAATFGFDAFGVVELAAGRAFTASEVSHNAPVILLSYMLAQELAAGRDAESLVGEFVRVAGLPREVVGVFAYSRGERCCSARVPFAAASTVFGPGVNLRIPQVMVKARDVEDMAAVKAGIQDWLATRVRGWEQSVQIRTREAQLAQTQNALGIMKLFLGALASISLLVGGVGIMNIMLANVTERTREIGVRKAIGARGRDIHMQFLTEAVAVSCFGSAMGIALGAAITALLVVGIRRVYHAESLGFVMSGQTVLFAAIAAVAIGLVFGTYPARRAARLSPIDAIRHE